MTEFDLGWQQVLAQREMWNSIPDRHLLKEKARGIEDVLIGTPDYCPVLIYEQYKGREGGTLETTAGKLRNALRRCVREAGYCWGIVLEGVPWRFSGFQEEEHYYSLWIPELTYEI